MSKITLFDLPCKGRCACWSLNPWKTRLALNYKNIDYETFWVEYPNVAPTLKDHLSPNQGPAKPYTIPSVRFSSGDYIMESKAIVTRLERDHPSPSLHLDSPVLKQVEQMLPKILEPLRAIWMPVVPNILNEPSREYFERTRAETLGKSLQEYAKTDGGEEAWVEALPGLKELGELIKKEGGPFVMGDTPSYADFVIVGMIHFFKVVDEDIYNRVVKAEPEFGKLYDACKQWLDRDDH